MREALKRRIGDQPARISREEIEALGTDMGLEPADAVRLFDRLKGVSWRGDYVDHGENGWAAAWVAEVN